MQCRDRLSEKNDYRFLVIRVNSSGNSESSSFLKAFCESIISRKEHVQMMSHTILVPHDGYEMSDKALKYAIEIAKGLNMNIKIIRVVEEVLDVSTMSHE